MKEVFQVWMIDVNDNEHEYTELEYNSYDEAKDAIEVQLLEQPRVKMEFYILKVFKN